MLDEDWSDLSCDPGRGIVVYEACEILPVCQQVILQTRLPVKPTHLFRDFTRRFPSATVGGLNNIVAKYRSRLENTFPNLDDGTNKSTAAVARMMDCFQRDLTEEIFEFLKDKKPKEFCGNGECLLRPESECSYWDVDLCEVAARQCITCSETGLECDDYSTMGSMLNALGNAVVVHSLHGCQACNIQKTA